MLHGLTDQRDHEGIGNSEEISIHVDDFEMICQLLKKHYTVLSLDDVVDMMENGEPVPPRTVVLTFDDGYESNVALGLPILKKYDLTGTLFVTTNFVDQKAFQWWDRMEFAVGHSPREEATLRLLDGPVSLDLSDRASRKRSYLDLLPRIKNSPQEELWNIVRDLEDTLEASLCDAASPPPIYRPASWDQIRAMHRSPHITIGAHTHTHRILAHCQETTVRKELERSLQLLKDEVGVERPLFSYPNGNHNEMTRRVVKEL
ncbi:MAG: polysaccharide deacetylase family protein, partial [Verrucomicrobiota bacterium]